VTQLAAAPTEDTATAEANAAVCACPPPDSTAKAYRELLDPEYLSLDELDQLTRAGVPVNVVDSRTERTYTESTNEIPGAVRLHPDHVLLDAERHQLSRDLVLAVLCA
jgi:hypothetical protein